MRCSLGHRHWGRFGAAGLLAYVPDGPVLLQQRTWWSHHGGTWGLPGGARDSHESVLEAALREAAEECGVPSDAVTPSGVFTDDHGGWSYTSVLAEAAQVFEVESDYDETEDVAWVEVPSVTSLALHPGFAEHWPELRAALETLTIIVDGANVVGTRPDGWWRDRAGAALRLRDELEPLAEVGLSELPDAHADAGPEADGSARPAQPGVRAPVLRLTWLPEIVLVVEGAARSAANGDDSMSPVRMVAAAGSGDDSIVTLAKQTPGRRVVVTADRELRRRCVAAGATVAGPRWLLGLL